MFNKIKSYFPKDGIMWKEFLFLVLPVIGGSILFALNSFVDNFMVGHIAGGTAGLFAANTWTSIIMGIFMGTSATGSILVAQYYYSGKHDKVKEIAKIRYGITIFVAISFTIAAQIKPNQMIEKFLGQKPSSNSIVNLKAWNAGLTQGSNYLKNITWMWLMIAITFNMGNICREIGYGKVTLFSGLMGLTLNITLNYTTMKTSLFGHQMGAEGAAWASVAGRIGSFSIMFLYGVIKKLPIMFNPLKFFRVSKEIHQAFWKRISIFGMTALTMVFITIRNQFYSDGYPEGGSLEAGIGAATFLGLTGAIFNIFSVIFNSINSIVAKFVGGELGKGNIDKAIENSKRLHGFNTSLAVALSIILLIISIWIPKMTFLQNTGSANISTHDQAVLLLTKKTMWPLALFYPFWIWFVTSKACAVSGGKVNLVSFLDAMTSGPLQLGWLAILMYAIVPHSKYLMQNFDITYFLFFLADIPRGISFMYVYYKTNWAVNITHKEALAKKYSALDNIQNEVSTKE